MIYMPLILLGLALGSFVNALVWRLHEQELLKKRETSRWGKTKKLIVYIFGLSSLTIKKNKKNQHQELSILKGRSMCPNCRHALAWSDLIPVLSWLSLKGRCRYCRKSISWQYPFVEVLMAVLVALSYVYWPYMLHEAVSIVLLAVWLIILTIFLALSVYDMHYMELPNRLVYPLYCLTFIFVGLEYMQDHSLSSLTAAVLGAVTIGGFFWLIYQASSGKWIGGGDVRLGFIMGGLLGWQKGLLALGLAAYLGTAVIIVIFLMGKYHKRMHLPFGPFLISATYISLLFGQYFIDLYKKLVGL